MGRRAGLATVILATVAVLVGLLAATAPAARTHPGAATDPAGVVDSQVSQDGQDLAWTLTLSRPSTVAALAEEHRRLCLALFAGPHAPIETGICLAPAQGGPNPRVGLADGAGRTVPGTVEGDGGARLVTRFAPAELGVRWTGPLYAQALTFVSRDGGCGVTGCVLRTPADPVRVPLHQPRLVGCEAAGRDWVFGGPAHRREVALTFDDGPWDSPPSIDFVRLLAREHAPATFFEIGDQIAGDDPGGRVQRQMLADGDMIGDHTWTHPNMTGLSRGAQIAQLEQTAQAIRADTGFTPCLFRAPYGAVDPKLLTLARSLGFATIQWDVDTRDWARPGVAAIEAAAISGARDGSIIIMHFGGGPRQQTLDALPTIIARLRHEGYRLVTVTQLLGYRLVYR